MASYESESGSESEEGIKLPYCYQLRNEDHLTQFLYMEQIVLAKNLVMHHRIIPTNNHIARLKPKDLGYRCGRALGAPDPSDEKDSLNYAFENTMFRDILFWRLQTKGDDPLKSMIKKDAVEKCLCEQMNYWDACWNCAATMVVDGSFNKKGLACYCLNDVVCNWCINHHILRKMFTPWHPNHHAIYGPVVRFSIYMCLTAQYTMDSRDDFWIPWDIINHVLTMIRR